MKYLRILLGGLLLLLALHTSSDVTLSETQWEQLVAANWLLSREGQSAVEKGIGYPSLRTDTPTKKDLRQFTVPKEGADYMVVSLEKYWYLDNEVRTLIKSAAK